MNLLNLEWFLYFESMNTILMDSRGTIFSESMSIYGSLTYIDIKLPTRNLVLLVYSNWVGN